MAIVKGRSPRQGRMLLYLCVALSRSAEPLQLSTLGADTTAAITAAARMLVQDKDLQVCGVWCVCVRGSLPLSAPVCVYVCVVCVCACATCS